MNRFGDENIRLNCVCVFELNINQTESSLCVFIQSCLASKTKGQTFVMRVVECQVTRDRKVANDQGANWSVARE